MTTVGDTLTPKLAVTPNDATTAAVLSLRDPDGDAVALPVTTADTGANWAAAPVVFAAVGRWWLDWTVTGTGAGTAHQAVDVAAAPGVPATPAGFTYATTADLARAGITPDDDSVAELVDASAEIDRLCRNAIYQTHPVTGLPVDAELRAALTRATVQLVQWWAETGLQTGSRGLVSSASIAGVSLGFAASSAAKGNTQANRIGPQVITTLTNAGLLGQRPRAGVPRDVVMVR